MKLGIYSFGDRAPDPRTGEQPTVAQTLANTLERIKLADELGLGFYGLGYTPGMDLTLPQNKILQLDPNRPIYASAETYVDLFVGYRTRMFGDKVRANFQLNVKNVTEDGGGLQATSAFFDGRASTYRIVDPRQFIISASFGSASDSDTESAASKSRDRTSMVIGPLTPGPRT